MSDLSVKYLIPFVESADSIVDFPPLDQDRAELLDSLLFAGSFLNAGAAPPAAPVTGTLWLYPADAAAGVYWLFRYNAASASAYKWEFVGGPPLNHEVVTSETTNSAAYVDLATVGPTLTLARAGDYLIDFSLDSSSSVAAKSAVIAAKLGAAAANDLESLVARHAEAGASQTGTRLLGKRTLAAADVVKLQYKVAGVTVGTFFNRRLRITPIRVA